MKRMKTWMRAVRRRSACYQFTLYAYGVPDLQAAGGVPRTGRESVARQDIVHRNLRAMNAIGTSDISERSLDEQHRRAFEQAAQHLHELRRVHAVDHAVVE